MIGPQPLDYGTSCMHNSCDTSPNHYDTTTMPPSSVPRKQVCSLGTRVPIKFPKDANAPSGHARAFYATFLLLPTTKRDGTPLSKYFPSGSRSFTSKMSSKRDGTSAMVTRSPPPLSQQKTLGLGAHNAAGLPREQLTSTNNQPCTSNDAKKTKFILLSKGTQEQGSQTAGGAVSTGFRSAVCGEVCRFHPT